jgi:cyanate permease
VIITLIAGFAGTVSFPLNHAFAEEIGWRGAVGVFVALEFFVALPLIWRGAVLMERSGLAKEIDLSHVAKEAEVILRNRLFWFLALSFTMGAVLHGVALHHLLPILHDRGIEPSFAVVAASFIGPMQVVGRLSMVAAGRHASSHKATFACFVLMGVAILALIGAEKWPILLPCFVVLFGGAWGMVSIIRPVITREVLGGNNFGAKSGSMAVPFLMGAASAPYLGALMWGIGGYDFVLVFLLGLAAVGLALYLAAHQLRRV